MTSKILSCPVPSNINPLTPNGFMFSITKLPGLSYFCQTVNIPSVSLGDFEQNTPFTTVPIPGERLEFGELNVEFLVDSNMDNYVAIYEWMKGLGFPIANDEFNNLVNGAQPADAGINAKLYSDGVLQILGNTNKPIRIIRFVDLTPMTLGSLTFTSSSSDVQYLVGSATFRYTYYTIE